MPIDPELDKARALISAMTLLMNHRPGMNTVLLFASFFLRDPAAIIAFVVATTLIALVLRRGHRRRDPRQLLATLAASAAIALIVSFTWLPGGDYAALNPTRWDPRRIIDSATSLPVGFGTVAHGTDGPLNVLLYVPAGLAITALVPRLPKTWRVPAALIALSLATEVWQALNGSRTGQLGDVIANGLGASLGTATTLTVRLLLHRRIRITASQSRSNQGHGPASCGVSDSCRLSSPHRDRFGTVHDAHPGRKGDVAARLKQAEFCRAAPSLASEEGGGTC